MSKEVAKKWYKQALHDLEMAGKNIGVEGYDVASLKERYKPLEEEND